MKQNNATYTNWAKSLILILLLIIPASAFSAEKSTRELATLGNEAFARGDFDKADSLYSEALQQEPDETALLYNKANVLYKNEKYDEALALYEKAIQKGPSRKLLSRIFFNAGNTCLKIAQKEKEPKSQDPLPELKQKLALYEKSFELYRQALENERAVSIAEGRNIERAGLYTRQNWALAREAWTATWEEIRNIERKNLQLEDGITELLQAQIALQPHLETIYLNSFTDDVLTFNLKRLAEHQRDFHEDILTLKKIAASEEEKIQTEIDNIQANQAQPPGPSSPPNQQPASPETTELQNQLQTAVQIKNAVEQAAALDEWIVDSLTRGVPLEAWQNLSKMITLLQDLTSFLKSTDPTLSAYHFLIAELSSSDLLLAQAAQIAEIKEKNEQTQLALQKRFKLAGTKNMATIDALSKIHFYLTKMKDTIGEESGKASEDSTPNGDQKEEENAADVKEHIFKEAFTESTLNFIDELLKKNQQLLEKIQNANTAIQDMKNLSLEAEQKRASQSFAWYKQLNIPLEQSIASLIENLDLLKDRLGHEDTSTQREIHLLEGPDANKMDTILFQLNTIQTFLQKRATELVPNSQKNEIQLIIKNLEKQVKNISIAWDNYSSLRTKEPGSDDGAKLSAASDLLRQELLNTLLIFSPDRAITLSFERGKKLHENLIALLPPNVNNSDSVLGAYKKDANQAKTLYELLENYFSALEKSHADPENIERQEAYTTSLKRRKNAASMMQRFINQGKYGASLLQKKKFQLTELLFKEMSESIAKAQLYFLDHPNDGEGALRLGIDLQNKLEAQSHFAREALAVDGTSNQVNRFLATSQEDISNVADRGKEAIEQTMGMAAVPTHGQSPQENQPPAGSGQPDPAQLKKVIEKIDEAKKQIKINKSFMDVGEFHNTFEKHQDILSLLQEALDLLINKEEQEGDDKKEENQEGEDQEKQKEDQNKDQGQDNQSGQGETKPKKPLELSASEARQLLEQLNQQDEKQQEGKAATVRKNFNTPRPW